MSALQAEPEQLNLLLLPGRRIPGAPKLVYRRFTDAERIAAEHDDTIRGWGADRYGRWEPATEGNGA